MDNALELGKAAEHLVCADLMLSGEVAFLSDQGLPFDVVVFRDNRLIRIQVKATVKAVNVNATGRNIRLAYSWSVRKRGKTGKGVRLNKQHCDVVALVALDTRKIAYLPIDICAQTVQIDLKPSLTKRYANGQSWSGGMDDFPFEAAVAGDLSVYETLRKIHIPGEPKPPRKIVRTYEQNRKYRENRKAKLDKERSLRGISLQKI